MLIYVAEKPLYVREKRMDRIAITGGQPLQGDIVISGAKNSAIKLMAVSLLTNQEIKLHHVPDLRDTRSMAELLTFLGARIDISQPGQMVLHVPHVKNETAPYDLVRKMRASFNVLGSLLARHGMAKVSLPGGCAIGARPVDLHLKALNVFGATIELEAGYVYAHAPAGGLKGCEINFPFISVGATEHCLLMAVLAQGDTILRNAAKEPEIVDLAACLQSMGAKIEGAGRSEIRITGVSQLHGTNYRVMPDRIEAGSYALAVATVGGDVRLHHICTEHLNALWPLLRQAGAKISLEEDRVHITRKEGILQSMDVDTQAYPGFPTDLQAQFMVMMSLADGVSIIRENIFENRFMHCQELMRMGANITVHGREAIVRGVKALRGAPVMATDLRASASLINAGLAAKGKTTIHRVYHLDRGFENIEKKLRGCGAHIQRL